MKSTTFKLGLLGLSTAFFFASCSSPKTEENTEMVAVEEAKMPTLTKIWETDSTLTTNESVLYDAATGKIYVANIEGDPSEKDGKGSISILDKDGKIVNQNWVTGLNAPKGMGITNGNLYVTDIDQVVEINLESGKIIKKYAVEGGKFLNDLATYDGKVYFTDMNTGKVHLLDAGKISTVTEGHESINGIAIGEDGMLYGLDKSGLKTLPSDDTSELLNGTVTGGDGLVILGDGNYIASRWAGEIYFVSSDGETLLLDTKDAESNTADIGFIPGDNIVLVPTFFKNKVVAYKLEY
ncbi:SMP-30/gluconolactonase/LRE family protein [Algoriphagus persicinus]|uniref:SMP-30/gluconolactonase/LRE family protein n=1 Tax=Algoriphagus persicinus TaxID=3108754 RepID=UPI002B3F4457|nr:ATP-binding protein [Algoriphagus sp. E1-3-M2]MEB2784703.1 ATP-binding protein [Algoriphagus sp. E1-3-M2]